MKSLLSVLVLLVAVCVSAFRPAASVMQSPDRETDSLRTLIMAVADTASPEVIFRIATLLESGSQSLTPDTAAAIRLLTRAADSNYPPALNYLGYKYITGTGVAPDTAAGVRMIHRAAYLGDARSYNNLGWFYLQGEVVPRDYAEALRWFELASRGGAPTAAAMLGDMYRDGLGTMPDTLAADSLYTLAIRRGLGDAQLRLIGLNASRWQSLTPDSLLTLGLSFYPAPGPAAGVVLFGIAADKGCPRADALLGDAYSRGIGVHADDKTALTHYYRAATGGNPSAAYVVAELLDMYPDALLILDSDTTLIDDPRYWYDHAAHGGISDAAQATDSLLSRH